MAKKKNNTSLQQAQLYDRAMHLRFQGKKHKEISDLLGVRYQRVRTWFQSGGPLHEPYKAFCAQMLQDKHVPETKNVAERIKSEAGPSLDTIVEIRNKKRYNPELRFKAATDLLDRAGYTPIQKSANVHGHMMEDMTASELDKTFQSLIQTASERLQKRAHGGKSLPKSGFTDTQES